MINYLIIVSVGILSFVLTYLIRSLALKHKILDVPNERSLHTASTPRGGGLAIVISWYLGITILFFLKKIDSSLYFALLSGVMLAIVSLIDDIVELKPSIRLLIQFLTALVAFFFIGKLRPLFMPSLEINYPLLIYPFAVVGMVWFINLFNFMDGVDGFASIEAIIICMVFYVFSSNVINLLLIASIAGFLFWNLPKAKIFMGDIGSTQLGFILVVLGLHFHNEIQFSILNWIMLASPFWFDATLTLYRRWRNGEKLSQAHRKHAYQRIVQAGYSHGMVDIFLILINIAIFGMIFLYRKMVILQIPLYFICMIFLCLLIKTIDKKFPFPKD